MSSEPLIDVIPIMRREQDGQIITQFDYPSCETLGLVKMDFLGLRNLTILDDAIENIRMNRGEEIDLDALSKDMTDKATYELLGRGDTLGVFQLDGGGMRSLLRLMQPDNFEDISAALALYRPGPMGANAHTNFALRKNGKQDIDYIHPDLTEALEPILGMTYGLIIYQEQVMEIAQKLAGYTLGNADLLRRAMGKKKKEVLDAEFANFEQGMLDNGYSKESIQTLWSILLPFSDYAFNKAHTAAYGLVSYWTGYLKANYPADQFDVGFCNGVLEHAGSRDAQRRFLAELLRVTKRCFLATPNRWFPVELHTRLPLLHWLPAPLFRRLLRALGLAFYAEEENLNLLTARELLALLPPGRRARLSYNRFLGLPSNLILGVDALHPRGQIDSVRAIS
jgi:DNA polymerase III alpha subunit